LQQPSKIAQGPIDPWSNAKLGEGGYSFKEQSIEFGTWSSPDAHDGCSQGDFWERAQGRELDEQEVDGSEHQNPNVSPTIWILTQVAQRTIVAAVHVVDVLQGLAAYHHVQDVDAQLHREL